MNIDDSLCVDAYKVKNFCDFQFIKCTRIYLKKKNTPEENVLHALLFVNENCLVMNDILEKVFFYFSFIF